MDISWKTILTDTYDILWKMIIRPPRSQYSVSELGPVKFRLGTGAYERKDFELRNERGQQLQCSHFMPLEAPNARPVKRPCVVYLHGNCSSRLEASDTLQVLLPRGITVFSLDLSGSGHSEGEYISLGHYEERDLRVVVQHLRNSGLVSAVGLWGRSMGAATTVLRAADDHLLAGCVIDSAFSSLRMVCEELVNGVIVTVPDFLLKMALDMVRGEIQTRAGFDIEELNPVRYSACAKCPALFAVARDDDFILPHHTQKLHNVWGGPKRLVTFGGGHNGARPHWFLEQAALFLDERLRHASGMPPPEPLVTTGVDEDRPPPLPWDGAHEDVPEMLPPPPPSPEKLSAKAAHAQEPPILPPEPVRPKRALGQLSRTTATPEAIRATKLISMGFSEDMAVEAAERYANVEAAVEWIMKQSMHVLQESAQTLGRVELRAPTRASGGSPLKGNGLQTERPLDRPTWSASESAPRSSSSRPPQADDVAVDGLVAQLVDLGFSPSKAHEAARRNSTVEGSVDWLLTHGGSQ